MWCVKESVRVLIYFNVLEPFFMGHRDSCVRGLLARLAQVFRRLKRVFVSTLRVSCSLFYCDQPGAGCHLCCLLERAVR